MTLRVRDTSTSAKRNHRTKHRARSIHRRFAVEAFIKAPQAPAAPVGHKSEPKELPLTPVQPHVSPTTGGVPDGALHRSHEAPTALTLYLREVGEVPLLSIAEEIALAARIQRGDEAAREHMIRANLRLVVKIAREYESLGLPLLDLINEGNLGLMKAVERFDPAKGGKLSTYSSWWIKQAMRRALANQSRTIRIPVHVGDRIYRLRLVAARLQEVLGREASDEELAEETGMSAARVAALRSTGIRPASLDMPLGDADTSRLADVIADEKAADPYQELEEKTDLSLMRELLGKLDHREAQILRHRFGLDNGAEKTLEEVGRQFGVTRERIRQLQNAALAKLRRLLAQEDAVPMAA